ncbi:MAG: hypothetical protein MJ102_06455 [Clostridia bacterium]|nr:hypothetical protein [Clostridia bacterium]
MIHPVGCFCADAVELLLPSYLKYLSADSRKYVHIAVLSLILSLTGYAGFSRSPHIAYVIPLW